MAHAARPSVVSISPRKAEAASTSHERPGVRGVQALAAIVLGMLSVVALGVVITLAVNHARDLYITNIASGSWAALAWHAEHGMLYPPLRDEQGHFAGTRYMPLQFLIHAGLARITGEFLFSGRIVNYGTAMAWMAAMIALVRQRGGGWIIAAALTASVLIAPVTIESLFSMRSDGLALAAQLWALWIIQRSASSRSAALAGLMCTIGFLAKLTAVWAAAGIAVWLLLGRRYRQFAAFVCTGVALTTAAIITLQLFSDGRMLTNFADSGGAGWLGWGAVLFWAPGRMSTFLTNWTPATWLLLPAATLAWVTMLRHRTVGAVDCAWPACGVLTLVMFADAGVGENHLLELAAIVAVAAAGLWSRVPVRGTQDDSRIFAHAWNPLALTWAYGLAIGLAWTMYRPAAIHLKHAMSHWYGGFGGGAHDTDDAWRDPDTLVALLRDRVFFSDDPLTWVLVNQRPLVSDAFMLRSMERRHPEWIDEVIARIDQREFELILLQQPADPDSWWYRRLFLGERIVRAISEHYQPASPSTHGRYHVYIPAE